MDIAEASRAGRVRRSSGPFIQALASGQLPLESYVGLLEALAIVFATLERSLEQSAEPSLRALRSVAGDRFVVLQRDLTALRAPGVAHVPGALAVAEEIAARMTSMSRRSPGSLLGVLFAVEEGPVVVTPALVDAATAAFGVAGTRYLAFVAGTGHDRRIAEALEGDDQPATALDAVHQLQPALDELVRALFPPTHVSTDSVASALNPEAGTHPVASDPREIEAALRAGARSWNEFPYFEARYGERGRRFTSSDSAWLVTLSELAQVQVNQQVLWLGGVLASRGMPRLTLEIHLHHLYDELCMAAPERADRYATLEAASRELQRRRLRRIDEATFEVVAASFQSSDMPLAGVGRLIVSAVTDECDGLENAVRSLTEWLTDPTRFSKAWLDAVGQTVARAREEAGRSL